MKKGTIKTTAAFLAVTGMCASMGIMALAAWQAVGDTDNILTMASYQNRIEEEYVVPDHVDPGAEVDKIVNVKNTGTVDTIIRVSVEKAFGTRNKDGTFVKEGDLEPDMIQITYNTTSWQEKKDGFFYYKDILKAGEMTKEPLFTSFTLSPGIGDAYEGKDAQIVVRMESVQAEGDAVSLWGMTYSELDIQAPEGADADPTCVTYLGKSEGFDIAAEKTDLFASFKNLLPGCSRTQRIYIKNDSDETVEIFLRADCARQKEMSDKQLRLVKQMLEEYALIEIIHGEETIYEGPVSGNLNGARHTMKNDISLGAFIPHNTEELKVKLSLDPAMDNEFLELSGKVKWIFTAKGEDRETISTVYPEKTGLQEVFGGCVWVFLLSLLLGISLLIWPGRKKAHV